MLIKCLVLWISVHLLPLWFSGVHGGLVHAIFRGHLPRMLQNHRETTLGESSFNMTREGGMKILRGGSENF